MRGTDDHLDRSNVPLRREIACFRLDITSCCRLSSQEKWWQTVVYVAANGNVALKRSG